MKSSFFYFFVVWVLSLAFQSFQSYADYLSVINFDRALLSEGLKTKLSNIDLKRIRFVIKTPIFFEADEKEVFLFSGGEFRSPKQITNSKDPLWKRAYAKISLAVPVKERFQLTIDAENPFEITSFQVQTRDGQIFTTFYFQNSELSQIEFRSFENSSHKEPTLETFYYISNLISAQKIGPIQLFSLIGALPYYGKRLGKISEISPEKTKFQFDSPIFIPKGKTEVLFCPHGVQLSIDSLSDDFTYPWAKLIIKEASPRDRYLIPNAENPLPISKIETRKVENEEEVKLEFDSPILDGIWFHGRRILGIFWGHESSLPPTLDEFHEISRMGNDILKRDQVFDLVIDVDPILLP